MSVQRSYPIACPKCGQRFETRLHDSLTLTVSGDERRALMENRVNVAHCPGCNAEFRVDKPLLVHDPRTTRAIYWLPGETVDGAERQALETLTSYASAVGGRDLPEMRVVLERSELIDKVFVAESGLDDRLVEYIKFIVSSRNPTKIDADEHDILFNGEDSDSTALAFVVQNRRSREIELLFRYDRAVYNEIGLLLDPAEDSNVSLKSLFPGLYVSFRRLLDRDDVADLPMPGPVR